MNFPTELRVKCTTQHILIIYNALIILNNKSGRGTKYPINKNRKSDYWQFVKMFIYMILIVSLLPSDYVRRHPTV